MKITLDTTLRELNALTVEEIVPLVREPEMIALADRIGQAKIMADVRADLFLRTRYQPDLYNYLKEHPRELKEEVVETAVTNIQDFLGEEDTDDLDPSVLRLLFPQFTEEE